MWYNYIMKYYLTIKINKVPKKEKKKKKRKSGKSGVGI